MILTIVLAIVVLWLLGVIIDFGGNFIHLLLVIGLIMLLVHFFSGRSNTSV